MSDPAAPRLSPPTPEQRCAAAGQFERASQVIATGNYDYGIQLLLNCCKLDPANLLYRKALRQTEKAKYQNNLFGSRLALLTTTAARTRVKAAKRARDYLKVLEQGEQVLVRNPWDTGAQLDMAEAAASLGLSDLAVWSLEQARQKDPDDPAVNRPLARLYEKRGNFAEAIQLWERIHKADPKDAEAARKANELAARDAIARVRSNPLQLGDGAEEDEAKEDEADEDEEVVSEDTATEPTDDGAADADEEEAARPAVDRVAREAAPVRARIKADPTNANAYLHLASIYRRVGQLEQARDVLREGLGPTGNDFDVMVALADIEIEPFRRNLALAEERLRADPRDEELRRIRIRLLKEINTRELDLYRRKVDRYPTDKASQFELGLRLLRAQQVDEAIAALQAARSEPRYEWRAYLYLGYCFKARNRWGLAQRNLEGALRSVPASETDARKEILFQLAQGHADAGEWSNALEYGYELANLDFAYRDISRLTDEWQDRLEAAEAAAEPPATGGDPAPPPAEEPY